MNFQIYKLLQIQIQRKKFNKIINTIHLWNQTISSHLRITNKKYTKAVVGAGR